MGRGLACVSFAGGLYGVERMTLNLAELLAADASTAVFAPPGPLHAEAGRLGIESVVFESELQLLQGFRRWRKPFAEVGAITSSVRHDVTLRAAALLAPGRVRQISIVHGGNSEAESFGHKRMLLKLGVKVVAVSEYVRERLAEHGVPASKVEIIENFLPERDQERIPARRPFGPDEIPTVGAVVSRFDTHKRLDLLADALLEDPEIRHQFKFLVIGGPGTASPELEQAFGRLDDCVTLVGFDPDPPRWIAGADFLLHLCPVEAFGMVVLEAMACNVPVVVPNVGGASGLVDDGVTGFTFDPDRAGDLGRALRQLTATSPSALNHMTRRAAGSLRTRFSGTRQREQLLASLAW